MWIENLNNQTINEELNNLEEWIEKSLQLRIFFSSLSEINTKKTEQILWKFLKKETV